MAKKFDMSKAMGNTAKKKVVSKTKATTTAPKVADEATNKIHGSEYKRTTVHIEKDLYVKLSLISAQEEISFKAAMNRALRKGLAE
jgi:hypothetical protein